MSQTPATPTAQNAPNEEPQIRQEEAIPSDGKDVEGEALMEELGDDKPGPALSPATPG